MPLTVDQIRARLVALLVEIDTTAADAILVRLGDNLPSLIASHPAGSVFLLADGFVHAGDLTLDKPCVLRSTRTLPAARIVPSLLVGGPIIKGATTITASSVRLQGLILTGATPDATILTAGPSTTVDRCLLRGHPQGQHRGVAVNAANITVEGCYIDNIFYTADAQAVAGWDGTRALRVQDCYLEASGENVIFGGADPASADRIPTDLVIEGCTLQKPLAWRTQPGVTVKNLFEVKNARQVLFQHNTCEHSWLSGQTGFALVLTVRNQDGTAPWSTVEQVQILDNTFAHCGAGINLLGSDDLHPSQRMTGVTMARNSFTDLDPVVWGGAGRQVQILNGPANVVLDHNTFEGKNLNTAFSFGGPTTLAAGLATGLVVTGNRFQEGEYGIHGPDAPALGQAVLDLYAPGYVWQDNTVVKGTSGRTIQYPPGTTLVSS